MIDSVGVVNTENGTATIGCVVSKQWRQPREALIREFNGKGLIFSLTYPTADGFTWFTAHRGEPDMPTDTFVSLVHEAIGFLNGYVIGIRDTKDPT